MPDSLSRSAARASSEASAPPPPELPPGREPLRWPLGVLEDVLDDELELAVDDDDDARDSLCALVGSLGVQTESFSSAEEFLAGCTEGRVGSGRR